MPNSRNLIATPTKPTRPVFSTFGYSQIAKPLYSGLRTLHQTAQKHVLRYSKGTTDLEIVFGATEDRGSLLNEAPLKIDGYTDASWGDNLDDRRSTTGFAFTLNGG